MTRAAPPDVDRGFSVYQAAEILGCRHGWVRAAIKAGLLRGYRVGRAVRVYESSIEEYRARHAEGAEPPPATKRKAARPGLAHRQALAELEKLGLG